MLSLLQHPRGQCNNREILDRFVVIASNLVDAIPLFLWSNPRSGLSTIVRTTLVRSFVRRAP
jgi:hypothetical protein